MSDRLTLAHAIGAAGISGNGQERACGTTKASKPRRDYRDKNG
jgi:hypothetical protein